MNKKLRSYFEGRVFIEISIQSEKTFEFSSFFFDFLFPKGYILLSLYQNHFSSSRKKRMEKKKS